MAKKAVLIGCNYPNKYFKLRGCINDVFSVRTCLLRFFGFQEKDISVLIDTDAKYTEPTGTNIRLALSTMVQAAKPGDFLFVHYSGHGHRLELKEGEEDETGWNECIVPCDANYIIDDEFRDFVLKVPDGCRITIISDSCHSGGLIDSLKEQIGESYKHQGVLEPLPDELGEYSRCFDFDFEVDQEDASDDNDSHAETNRSLPVPALVEFLKQKTGKKHINSRDIGATLFEMFGEKASPGIKNFMNKVRNRATFCGFTSVINIFFMKHFRGTKQICDGVVENGVKCLPKNGILISGCQTDEVSRIKHSNGKLRGSYGAMTNAVLTILCKTKGKISNKELVLRTREMLSKDGFSQHPGLYCTDSFLDAPFLCS